MSFVVVIPSRLASTRLPNKPLLDIGGKTMIQRVWEQACKSQATNVCIATDHPSIFEEAKRFGAEVCMTSHSHESGTDRLEEVARLMHYDKDQVIVNVQGDEPLIPPEVINQVAQLMQSTVQMATLYERIESVEQLFDPNVVKLITNQQQDAMYFSRAPLPWYRDGFAGDEKQLDAKIHYKRHIGIYAYRAQLLTQFVTWPMSELESSEKLEQLRVLSNGIAIRVAEAITTIPPGVDTQKDLDLVRAYIAKSEP